MRVRLDAARVNVGKLIVAAVVFVVVNFLIVSGIVIIVIIGMFFDLVDFENPQLPRRQLAERS
jgi:hypothetical protein